jgi:two-component system sensor histidine kinase DesK
MSEHRENGDIPQPQLARRILFAVVASYAFVGLINLRLDDPGQTARFGWSVLCMAVVFALVVMHMSARAPRWPLWRRAASLGAQAAFTFVPFFVLHEVWGGMGGFLAGSFLLLVRRPVAWIFFTLTVAGLGVFAYATEHTLEWTAYNLVSTMLLGLVVFGMARLTQLVIELAVMRGELAQMAVFQERLRFARDLHDLLGYSLSSITLKSELAYRLVQNQPERARAELTEILEAARQALADVREVASGYRELSLVAEAASARRMLETAQIEALVRIDLPALPSDIDTVLATTLREGVTNILRHSKVQCCNIAATRTAVGIRLEVANDGVVDRDEGDEHRSGSGLGNLRGRLGAFGGTLRAGVEGEAAGRWFRLVAEIPWDGGPTSSGGVDARRTDQAAAG